MMVEKVVHRGLRPVTDVREIVNQHVATLAAEHGTRIDALQKAFEKQTEDYNRVPTLLQTAISNLKELLEAKIDTSASVAKLELEVHCQESKRRFRGIDDRFGERDTRVDQQTMSTKLAVDAALVSLKETISKLEDGFTKQIDAMIRNMDDKNKESDRRINDLKDNHTRFESVLMGVSKGGKEVWGFAVGAAGMVLACVSTIALVIKWVVR